MRPHVFVAVCVGLLAFSESASAQICRPVEQRSGNAVGCWIIAHQPLGQFTQPQTFWHLDTYPTLAAAEQAKGPHGTVVKSLDRIWLLSIEQRDWRAPAGGEHVAEIGPLVINAGENYSAQYMEAVFDPGMTAPEHRHSGPEAWYTLAGETCLETPDGMQVGKAGSHHVIVPAGPPMHLTATGTVQRKALVLILHDSSKPPTTPERDWKPKGLCKG